MIAAASQLLSADGIPGLSELPEKVLTQCGLVTLVLLVAILWLASQLAKAHSGWEADRASMLKNSQEQNAAYERMASAHAELRGIVLSMQMARGAGADDD